ncbi:restriction endonuclease subunit S [Enterococcus faecium]|nr:restriction endonuclease subunit S [Enterococcus faecium]
MSKDKQPEIRFPGFTEDWEERKLDEIFGKIRNAFVGTATPYYVDEGHFYLESNNVKDGRINRNTEVFINDEFYEKQKDKWLHTNDIVMVQSGHVGHTAVIPEDLDKTAAHALIMFSNYKTKTSPFFLNYQFQTLTAKRKLENITTGNTIKHILASEMKKFEVTIPEHVEQQKIGSFFKTFDDTIALHQRKLDLLKETKKGFLQKMFPKNGAKVPEIRFPGFTDDWEQRTLGDILKEFSIKSKVENEYTVLSSTNSGMEIRNGRVSGVSNLGYKIIENGDLVLSPQNLWLGNININNVGTGLVSPSYKTFKFIKVDPGFIRPQLRTARMLEEYKNSSTQGASVVRRNLELGSFYQITIKIPSDVEQGKIGLFFKQLDNLIALRQRKLDLLKETKKGFLQKMFV